MTFEIFQIMKGCIRVNTELRLTFAEVSKAVERIKDIIQIYIEKFNTIDNLKFSKFFNARIFQDAQ